MEILASIIGQGLLTGEGAIQPDFSFVGKNAGTFYVHQGYCFVMSKPYSFIYIDLFILLGNSSSEEYIYSNSEGDFSQLYCTQPHFY